MPTTARGEGPETCRHWHAADPSTSGLGHTNEADLCAALEVGLNPGLQSDPGIRPAAQARGAAAFAPGKTEAISGGSSGLRSQRVRFRALGLALGWRESCCGDLTVQRRLLTDRWRHDGVEASVDPAADGNMFSYHYRSPRSTCTRTRTGPPNSSRRCSAWPGRRSTGCSSAPGAERSSRSTRNTGAKDPRPALRWGSTWGAMDRRSATCVSSLHIAEGHCGKLVPGGRTINHRATWL
jgi:hypothetical protein